MQTYTGRQFWPCDPLPEDVCIEDIAHSLALQCRFAGHCLEHYSVAEHSVRVMRVVVDTVNGPTGADFTAAQRRWSILGALLHDASEAYCVDVPRPLKPFLTNYREIEDGVTAAIEAWAGLPVGACSMTWVKRADEILLMTEARDLMSAPPVPWSFAKDVAYEPLPDVIVPWGWEVAERRFLGAFAEIADEGRR